MERPFRSELECRGGRRLAKVMLFFFFPVSNAEWLINGESSSWALTSSPGAYYNCATYDICDVDHAADGTGTDLTGQAFVFQTPWGGYAGGPPYDITIDMGSDVTLSRYRFYRSTMYTSAAKTMVLQSSTDGGISFNDIDDSTISMPSTGGAWHESSEFESTTAAIWRVRITEAYAASATPQLYFTEVQFYAVADADDGATARADSEDDATEDDATAQADSDDAYDATTRADSEDDATGQAVVMWVLIAFAILVFMIAVSFAAYNLGHKAAEREGIAAYAANVRVAPIASPIDSNQAAATAHLPPAAGNAQLVHIVQPHTAQPIPEAQVAQSTLSEKLATL